MLFLGVNESHFLKILTEYRLPIIRNREKYQLMFLKPQTLREWLLMIFVWVKGNNLFRKIEIQEGIKMFGFFMYVEHEMVKKFLITEENFMVC